MLRKSSQTSEINLILFFSTRYQRVSLLASHVIRSTAGVGTETFTLSTLRYVNDLPSNVISDHTCMCTDGTSFIDIGPMR